VAEAGTVKLADFGMTRRYGDHTYAYVKSSDEAVPVKWMAPEAIGERVFTEKSDVWSFGVLMWEIFSDGAEPYGALDPHVVAERVCAGLLRLGRPQGACPDDVWAVMEACWAAEADARPTFGSLYYALSEEVSVE
jgi:serine/threonine protein kinase